MKLISNVFGRFFAFLVLMLSSVVAFAQEKGADINVDINKGGSSSNWYASPWVWIVGGAVFVLLLVALLRGRNAD